MENRNDNTNNEVFDADHYLNSEKYDAAHYLDNDNKKEKYDAEHYSGKNIADGKVQNSETVSENKNEAGIFAAYENSKDNGQIDLDHYSKEIDKKRVVLLAIAVICFLFLIGVVIISANEIREKKSADTSGNSATDEVDENEFDITYESYLDSESKKGTLLNNGLKDKISNIDERNSKKIENTTNSENESTEKDSVTFYEDPEIIEQYADDKVRLVFDANGGNSVPDKTVFYGKTYGELPVPTRKGYSFKGWYTSENGGTQIVPSSIVSINTDHMIFALWTVNSYTVSWNNGTGYHISVLRTSSPNAGASTGNLSNGSHIYYGDVLSVSYKNDEYYTLKSYGKTSITVTGNVTSNDIYASAVQNSNSEWIKEGNIPTSAQVVKTEYRYKVKKTTTSSQSSLSGWNLDYSERTDWGPTKGPVANDPSNGSRNVWSAGTKTVYKYNHCYGKIQNGQYGWGSIAQNPGAKEGKNIHRIESDEPLKYVKTSGGNKWYGSYVCPQCGEANMWIPDGTVKKSLGYYYQEPVYTYHYYKIENKTSNSYPTEPGCYDVEKYVQYRFK